MKQFLIAIDQVFNTIISVKGDGFGMADETISARAWRLREKSMFPYKFINMLFFWQNNHCRGAFNAEMQRKHMPSAYQDLDKS